MGRMAKSAASPKTLMVARAAVAVDFLDFG